jgi:hypothetical protein
VCLHCSDVEQPRHLHDQQRPKSFWRGLDVINAAMRGGILTRACRELCLENYA